jgi:hypothetical protein
MTRRVEFLVEVDNPIWLADQLENVLGFGLLRTDPVTQEFYIENGHFVVLTGAQYVRMMRSFLQKAGCYRGERPEQTARLTDSG